jgi:nitrate reductase gamma subunit
MSTRIFVGQTIAVCLLYTTEALAQVPPAAGPTDAPVPSLMFFTLGAVLLILIGAFVMFLRRRSNRDVAAKVLNPNDPSNK